MTIRYDPVLTAALRVEIQARWQGRRTIGLMLDAARRDAWIVFGASGSGPESLGFLLHPSRGHVVVRTVEEEDLAFDIPFRNLHLSAVQQPADERRLVLAFAGAAPGGDAPCEPVFTLHIELHTNQWNAVLTRGSHGPIEAVLWPREAGRRILRRGTPYQPPERSRRWVEQPPDLQSWQSLLEGLSHAARRRQLLERVAWTSTINVDWVLGGESDGPADSLDRYLRLRRDDPEGAWILGPPERLQPYPLPLGAEAQRYPDLLTAMRVAAVRSGKWTPDDELGRAAGVSPVAGEDAADRDVLLRELDRRVRRLRKRRSALERQLAGEAAEALRGIGHLLLARQAEIPRGAGKVTLDDFDGTPLHIVLDPTLDAVRNAHRYYDRARRRERAATRLPASIGKVSAQIAELESTIAAVRGGEATDEAWDLVGGREALRQRARRTPGSPQSRGVLPYWSYRTSSGLEVRVGRSARANDDLTFRHAAPEDIWMHARQSPGAHVVLRWGRRDQNPPRADLLEAASLAALHSEARHSSLVAVDWTRRKYVRKPRKSAPGAVIPERVRTVLVEPDASLAGRRSTEDEVP